MKKLGKKILALMLVMLAFTMSGCFKTDLQKGDEAYAAGNYQEAMRCYNLHLEDYLKRMGGTYSSLDVARSDAMKVVEGYYKLGQTHEALGDSASARAMYLKASVDAYDVKYGYYVKEEVWVEAGYQQVWVPGYYKDVWVDGYYNSNGAYVNGYYNKVWVDGQYQSQWMAAHYEMKDIYKEKYERIRISSPYVDQARAKAGTAVAPTDGGVIPNPTGTTDKNLKDSYDRMAAAYKVWIAEGMPKSGQSCTNYMNAKAEYERLLASTPGQR